MRCHEDRAEILPRILEIGCGTGLLTTKLIGVLPPSGITLLDIAPSMLKICEKKLGNIIADSMSARHKYKFVCSDVTQYDLSRENEKFALVVSSMALQWVRDIGLVLTKILQNSNLFAFTLPMAGSLWQWYELCDELDIEYKTIRLYRGRDMLQHIKDCSANPGGSIEFREEIVTIGYETALDFALHLKRIGASSGYKIDESVDSYSTHHPLNRYLYHSIEQPKIGREEKKMGTKSILHSRKILAQRKNFNVDYLVGYFFLSSGF